MIQLDLNIKAAPNGVLCKDGVRLNTSKFAALRMVSLWLQSKLASVSGDGS